MIYFILVLFNVQIFLIELNNLFLLYIMIHFIFYNLFYLL